MDKKNTKVSLIMPIYNVGMYFRDCLDSALNQSHSNFELILIDDGSTDNSGLIADEYAKKDQRIKVFHQKNAGVSTARNKGIEKATGEYICFSDPDDLLKSDYIEYLLGLCIEHNADISVCAEVFTTFKRSQREDNIQIVSGEDAAAQILYGKITVGCYSKMFKRVFLNENNIRFLPDVYVGEGFNFNVSAFCSAKKVVVSQHKVYFYRLDNSASAMTDFNPKKCEMGLKAIDIIRQNLTIRSKKLENAVDFADWNTHGSFYEWIVRAGVKRYYPELYKRCLNKTWKLSYKAIFAPITSRDRIIAASRMIHPCIWAYARLLARRIVAWRNN